MKEPLPAIGFFKKFLKYDEIKPKLTKTNLCTTIVDVSRPNIWYKLPININNNR